MCGRFEMIARKELLRIVREMQEGMLLEVPNDFSACAAAGDAYPGATVPVLVSADAGCLSESCEVAAPTLGIADLTWGYPVSWSSRPVFNTRIETATGSSGNMWRDSLEKRRCVVPTLGFYEPHRTERVLSTRSGREIKAQYSFALAKGPVTFLAGVYENDCFSVMTTEPNRWVADVHDRMPVVLRPEELLVWLGSEYTSVFDRSEVELRRRLAA